LSHWEKNENIPLIIIRFNREHYNWFLEKNLKISKKIFKTIKKDIFQKKYRGVTKVSCGI